MKPQPFAEVEIIRDDPQRNVRAGQRDTFSTGCQTHRAVKRVRSSSCMSDPALKTRPLRFLNHGFNP